MELDKVLKESVDNVADNLFRSVTNSVSEVKAMQQRKAAENVQIVVQALKKIEKDLRETNDEVAIELASRIASIKDGKDGKDGKNGKDGRDGKAGRDGSQGLQGQKGADGLDGVDGVDGVSVTDAKIDFDGSLVITLSTGQEINVGEVVPTDIAEKIKVFTTNGSTAGGSALIIKDENTVLTSAATSINFAGAGVTATTSGNDVTVTVSTGSGSVTSVAATAGTGISITGSPITTSGTLNITNTLPDQTVVLTASTGISTSGTYPNFTITNSAPDQTVSLTASTGISTSGTYPNFTITNSAPDQTVALTGAGSTTITGTYPNFTITSSGDVAGPASSTDNAITRFDSTTGKLVQNSLVTVADDGAITAPQVGSIIPFYFANQAAFPSASTYHGAIAHSHSDGAMYFAHGGVWTRILNDSGPLGTPSSGTLTNATGLPISTGVSGLGTGIATALAVNVGVGGAPALVNGVLGTPSSGTVTNLTGTASININGTVGATTPSTVAATTISAAGTSSAKAFKTPNIAEVITVSATAATGTINYDVTTQSVLYYTTNASGNFTVNFRGSSGTSLNTVMSTGESISATFLVTNGATAYYNSVVQVDGSTVTPKWQGGSAPTSGNASSIDSYTYVIIKTASATFTVLAAQTKFA